MAHRNALDLDSAHNSAIREEIGERLRVLLSKEQPKPPPRVQHLLDRLNALDAPGVRSRNRRLRDLKVVRMEELDRRKGELDRRKGGLDRRKGEALVAVTLCTGTLIACFGIALALL